MKKILFDTDLGDDCDDVLALDLLLAANRFGECELTGITYSSICRNSPSCIHAITSYYGMGNIPIGRMTIPENTKNGKDYYATAVTERFTGKDAPTYATSLDAVKLLRKLLVENGHSTIAVTGYMTNIAALLQSEADEYSPLSGMELVLETVDEFAVMGCDFAHQDALNLRVRGVDENNDAVIIPEWNIIGDIAAAQYMFRYSPVPIVVSPYSVGYKMCTGAPMVHVGRGETPDSLSFILRNFPEGRDSFDPTTVLYAIYGAKPWFYRSVPGEVTILDDGTSFFSTINGGNTRVLGCAMSKESIAKDIDDKVMRIAKQRNME